MCAPFCYASSMSSQDANRDGAFASAADTRAGLWAASGRRREREARGLNSSAAAAVLRRLWATGQRLFTTSLLYNVGAWPAERASNQGAELQSHSTQQAGVWHTTMRPRWPPKPLTASASPAQLTANDAPRLSARRRGRSRTSYTTCPQWRRDTPIRCTVVLDVA